MAYFNLIWSVLVLNTMYVNTVDSEPASCVGSPLDINTQFVGGNATIRLPLSITDLSFSVEMQYEAKANIKILKLMPVLTDDQKCILDDYSNIILCYQHSEVHWGRTDEGGSDHTIDGWGYAMEIQHFFHRTNSSHSLSPLSVAVLFYLEESHNKEVTVYNEQETLLEEDYFSLHNKYPHFMKQRSLMKFNFSLLLPPELDKAQYFQYSGTDSGTCSDDRDWLVFEDPLYVSPSFLKFVRSLSEENDDDNHFTNFDMESCILYSNYLPDSHPHTCTIEKSTVQEGNTWVEFVTNNSKSEINLIESSALNSLNETMKHSKLIDVAASPIPAIGLITPLTGVSDNILNKELTVMTQNENPTSTDIPEYEWDHRSQFMLQYERNISSLTERESNDGLVVTQQNERPYAMDPSEIEPDPDLMIIQQTERPSSLEPSEYEWNHRLEFMHLMERLYPMDSSNTELYQALLISQKNERPISMETSHNKSDHGLMVTQLSKEPILMDPSDIELDHDLVTQHNENSASMNPLGIKLDNPLFMPSREMLTSTEIFKKHNTESQSERSSLLEPSEYEWNHRLEFMHLMERLYPIDSSNTELYQTLSNENESPTSIDPSDIESDHSLMVMQQNVRPTSLHPLEIESSRTLLLSQLNKIPKSKHLSDIESDPGLMATQQSELTTSKDPSDVELDHDLVVTQQNEEPASMDPLGMELDHHLVFIPPTEILPSTEISKIPITESHKMFTNGHEESNNGVNLMQFHSNSSVLFNHIVTTSKPEFSMATVKSSQTAVTFSQETTGKPTENMVTSLTTVKSSPTVEPAVKSAQKGAKGPLTAQKNTNSIEENETIKEVESEHNASCSKLVAIHLLILSLMFVHGVKVFNACSGFQGEAF